MPNEPSGLKIQILSVAGRITVLHECDPDDPLAVLFRRGIIRVTFTFTPLELAPYLPRSSDPLDELTADDRSILRVLADAPAPLLGKDIAQALRSRREWSTLRERLGPRAPLRRLGLVAHDDGEGYILTESGRALAGQL